MGEFEFGCDETLSDTESAYKKSQVMIEQLSRQSKTGWYIIS